MAGVPEHADHEDEAGRKQDRDSNLPPEPIQLLWERRLFLRSLLDESGDLAELSRHASLDEDGPPSPAVDCGPHEHHVLAVTQVGVARLRLDGLAHGERLAGQGGLVDAEARHLEEPGVRGDSVSRREDDDLPGHQLAGRHGNDPALPKAWALRA